MFVFASANCDLWRCRVFQERLLEPTDEQKTFPDTLRASCDFLSSIIKRWLNCQCEQFCWQNDARRKRLKKRQQTNKFLISIELLNVFFLPLAFDRTLSTKHFYSSIKWHSKCFSGPWRAAEVKVTFKVKCKYQEWQISAQWFAISPSINEH